VIHQLYLFLKFRYIDRCADVIVFLVNSILWFGSKDSKEANVHTPKDLADPLPPVRIKNRLSELNNV